MVILGTIGRVKPDPPWIQFSFSFPIWNSFQPLTLALQTRSESYLKLCNYCHLISLVSSSGFFLTFTSFLYKGRWGFQWCKPVTSHPVPLLGLITITATVIYPLYNKELSTVHLDLYLNFFEWLCNLITSCHWLVHSSLNRLTHFLTVPLVITISSNISTTWQWV